MAAVAADPSRPGATQFIKLEKYCVCARARIRPLNATCIFVKRNIMMLLLLHASGNITLKMIMLLDAL